MEVVNTFNQNGTESTCQYSKRLCNFGFFLWNCSLLLNVIIFLPQLYKLHRKRRYQNIANGTWRWFAHGGLGVNVNFAIVMEVWLFLTALGLLCYSLVLSETHFDYQRPLTLGLTLLGSILILTISCVNTKNAHAMKGLASILAMIQIYPQLLLSELLTTSKAVSVWTILLFLLKYCLYYIAQYIVFTSTEEFIFSYMTTSMYLAALFHCFAYPSDVRVLPGSNDISRSQFTVLPPSSTTEQSSRSTSAGIDGFFSIDDFDNSDIDNTPVNLPTVTARQDGQRNTIACLSWYTTCILIAVVAVLLTIGLTWKVPRFFVILAPLCIVLLVISIFSFKHFLPDRVLTAVKFIL
ncbi:hypothetical protein GJ496_010013 [Pomphorhynchus laevis]|nr:hypothetical protein GJ496_010013 [Pomphorhynchus laevis]